MKGSVAVDLLRETGGLPQCNAPIYHPASWKNVNFFVDTTSDEFGRRNDIYEYPLSDSIGLKDLGRKARRFKVEGYLIGTDQLDQTVRMVNVSETDEPGILVHPMYGAQTVALISLSVSADYRKDKKRTKLSFEFVEAATSMAPFQVGQSVQNVFNQANIAARTGMTNLSGGAPGVSGAINQPMYSPNAPPPTPVPTASPEGMVEFRALAAPAFESMAARAAAPMTSVPVAHLRSEWENFALGVHREVVRHLRTGMLQTTDNEQLTITALDAVDWLTAPSYPTFLDVAQPIDFGTAIIRQLNGDALKALKDLNAYVVDRSERIEMTDSVQALVVTTRLSIVRDMAVRALQTNFPTIKAALDVLDLIMAICDDEEEIATRRCDDVLVNAIRATRAMAAEGILAAAIHLPGIHEYNVDGEWPSLVVAHKLYNNARRYEQVEAYNPAMPVFFMGRSVIAPSQ